MMLPAPRPAQPLGEQRVVFADDTLVVVDKPAGLLSVPGRGPDKADCAWSRVQASYPDALVVHRLDMGTSGLLVFGRGAAAQRALSMAFEQRLTDKRYEAIVGGAVPDMAGEINLPLIADWPRRPRQMVDMAIGKPSLTRWERLALETGLPGTTRLALFPVTGRSHQLRVHLQAIGHPIVGDELYAPPDIETLAPRLLLHASHLTLPHPATGQAMAFHAPTPF